MAGVSTYVNLGRTSSLELEPKTLDFHQIQYAREAALYILNTKSMEEAFHIFTQGLEPVTSCTVQGRRHNEVQKTSMKSEEAEFDDNNDDDDDEEFYNNPLFGLDGFRDVSTWPL